MAYTIAPTLTSTISFSITHRPSPPPSRTSCPPLHRLPSAPLSTVVWALIAGGKKKKERTHIYVQSRAHTIETNTHNALPQPGRSQPCLLRLHPKQVTRKSSPESHSASYPAPFQSFFVCMCLFFSPTFYVPVWWHALAARTTFTPRPLLLFIFPPLVYRRGGGGGEYKLHLRPQVMNQVSQWSSHSTWWPEAIRGRSVQLHAQT